MNLEIVDPVAEEIIEIHKRIEGGFRTVIEDAVMIGKLLIGQKNNMKHGAFVPWVENDLPFGLRTAQQYARLARNVEKIVDALSIETALKGLAEPKPPKAKAQLPAHLDDETTEAEDHEVVDYEVVDDDAPESVLLYDFLVNGQAEAPDIPSELTDEDQAKILFEFDKIINLLKKLRREVIQLGHDDKRYAQDFQERLRDAFLKKNEDFEFKKEMPHIKWLSDAALKKDNPEIFMSALLAHYWELINFGSDAFWTKQPFVPSALRSLYPRVLKSMIEVDRKDAHSDLVNEILGDDDR